MLVTFSIGSPLAPEAVLQHKQPRASMQMLLLIVMESNIIGTFAVPYKDLLVEAILLNIAANILLKCIPTLFLF